VHFRSARSGWLRPAWDRAWPALPLEQRKILPQIDSLFEGRLQIAGRVREASVWRSTSGPSNAFRTAMPYWFSQRCTLGSTRVAENEARWVSRGAGWHHRPRLPAQNMPPQQRHPCRPAWQKVVLHTGRNRTLGLKFSGAESIRSSNSADEKLLSSGFAADSEFRSLIRSLSAVDRRARALAHREKAVPTRRYLHLLGITSFLEA